MNIYKNKSILERDTELFIKNTIGKIFGSESEIGGSIII